MSRGLIYLAEVLGGVALLAAPIAYAVLTVGPYVLTEETWALVLALVAWSPLPVLLAAWLLDL